MYGKLFDQMYKGTLADDWKALVTFQQMIIMSDADGVIDVTPGHISRHTGIPVDVISDGVAALEQPDPHSRTPDMEGRRIVRLEEHRDWGWYIVNHEKYKNMKDMDEVRAANRERKRLQREREKSHVESQDVTDGHAKSHHTDTDANTDDISPNGDMSVPPGKPTRKLKVQHEQVIDLYHETLPELPPVVKSRWPGSTREKNLSLRLKEDERHRSAEFWRWYFAIVRTNPHWMGQSEGGWKPPGLSWFLTRSRFDQVIELGASNAT